MTAATAATATASTTTTTNATTAATAATAAKAATKATATRPMPAARMPAPVALSLAASTVALLAWALGEAMRPLLAGVAPWPLGATMLGWFAASASSAGTPGRGPGGFARDDAGGHAMRSGAAAATLVVAAVHAMRHGPAAALAVAVAGVVLPALAAALLTHLATRFPPRGVGGREVRLLAGALALVPLAALLRSLAEPAASAIPGPEDGPGGGPGGALAALLAGELLAATVFAPLALALAPWVAARIAPDRRSHGGATAGPDASWTVPHRRPMAIAAAAIAACAALTAALLLAGHADLARIAAVGHLPIGLLIARSVPGGRGALALAVNACAMACLHAAWPDPVAGAGRDALRDPATLLTLAGVFALQFLLQSVGTDRRESARALVRRSMQSDLSGLPNQRALLRIVDAMLSRPERRAFWLVGVVLPDIARWSDLTDRAAAAELERAVADRLDACFGPLGARLSHPASGRFVLTVDDRPDGLAIRRTLHAALGGQRFDTRGQSIRLRHLAGIVDVPAGTPLDAQAVLTTLSMALQRAALEPAGIHRTTATEAALADYRTELHTVEAVGRALDEGRIRLYAERIEPARPDGPAPLRFEVLARVLDESGGLLEPGQFLPAVLHAGLSSELDRLVFERTVAFLASDPRLHAATRSCSINVSGPTLCDPGFPEHVRRCLDTHAVDPARLTLEITESSAIADLELARAHVERLAGMGLGIALDDFGTGLATFDYLKRLRADVLKVDGSFVRSLVGSDLDREIVASMVRIARATGALTVAEWIETDAQRELVAALGVDFVQGRLIAPPVPIEDLPVPAPDDGSASGAGR
jgi:EAL domain-containing protein (putative c-di-GMP-specific phosphodiesterase class I)/GGDEF domain-containing protein